MAKPSGIITLTSDFGYGGEYVGVMKGVILRINPKCQLIDITHQISPQNIFQASLVLQNSYSFFPKGTIHMVIVDPGVGTARRPIIIKKEGYFFVGPDNGVFTPIIKEGKFTAFEITFRPSLKWPESSTFHGRDIFAPTAAYLSLGKEAQKFGPPIANLQRLDWPLPVLKGQKVIGQILLADPFGNLITNITRDFFESQIASRRFQIKGKGWSISCLQKTYDQVPVGQPLALFGSAGFLEIAINRGNASQALQLKPGDSFIINLN